MVSMADIPLIEAIRMISMTPAKIIGVSDKKGSLVAGKDADVVIFNDDIEIDTTLIKGKVVYQKAY